MSNALRQHSFRLFLTREQHGILRSNMTNPEVHESYWRKCNSCKKEIPYSQLFWVCNVSTCNRKRTGLVFCTVSCWDAHGPMMNHRESWAEERKSPTKAEWIQILADEAAPKKRGPREKPVAPEPVKAAPTAPPKVLVRRGGQGS